MRSYQVVLLLFISLSSLPMAAAQLPFPPVAEAAVRRIDAHRTHASLQIDGQLREAAWGSTQRSPSFVDLITGTPTIHDTRVRLLWDAEYLYVAFEIEEPHVQAKFTQRDSPIYQDNDVELFIAGRDAYYEFEINAHGTLYEGLFVWQDTYQTSGLSQIAEIDKARPEVRWQSFHGVGLKNHPRGARWAFLDWDMPGLKAAVHIDGTLNDGSDRDRGWQAEVAIPWKELELLDLSQPRALPPAAGDVWRIDFSRFNQYKEAPPAEDSGGWALSYHGVWDSHIPECFPFVRFVDGNP